MREQERAAQPSTSEPAAPPGTHNGSPVTRAPLERLVAPVQHDVDELDAMLRSAVGEDDPTLTAAADKIFGSGGKKLRPTMVFLVARATALLSNHPSALLAGRGSALLRCSACAPSRRDITERHKRIAMVSEMLHAASLIHDDVLDDSSTRRGSLPPPPWLSPAVVSRI